MRSIRLSFILIILAASFIANAQKKFRLVPSDESGVTFSNSLTNYEMMNVFVSQYFYNGGGVAIGDINNDGLSDIFMVANYGPDKLYLNKGDFKFEDISASAGIQGTESWETGVTMCDVNNDGWLDIYVSRSGLAPDAPYSNLLYINQKDNTFYESAFDYGLSESAHSTQMYFFDYDLDGDLDAFMLNHNVNRIDATNFGNTFRDLFVGDKLFRNDGGYFTDVSEKAGIIAKTISFGLGALIGDINKDGYPDIYVCNDFAERDYMYFNNGDGTFTERLKEQMPHIPYYSMGGDIADFNNDGWLDIMTLDMTAEDNFKQKANMNSMNPDKFWAIVEDGRHYQYMINSLQLNNGNGTFSDISYMTDLAYTDWSWGPLFADFDNDGLKDLFISNGYRVDISNKDYVNWYKERDQNLNQKTQGERNFAAEFQIALEKLTSEKVPNYMMKNTGNLDFINVTEDWGLEEPSFSNGFAYGDLDNDGDLDLVINNIDMEAFIYENQSDVQKDRYMRIKFEGSEGNRMGLGTKVTLKNNGVNQYQEHYVGRGYQSSVEPVMHFGVGDSKSVDEIEIVWFDGKTQTLNNVESNKVITVKYTDAKMNTVKKPEIQTLFTDITKESKIDFKHTENEYDDFEKEVLLPHKLSQFGPSLAVGDINGDKLDDFYVGGASGQSGSLYVQQKDGTFLAIEGPWEAHKNSEDIDAVFFDADGDKDLDLYVVSGGNEFEANDPLLKDRLYINQNGSFVDGSSNLPQNMISGGVVVAGDYDKDGDMDLFIGGRLNQRNYPFPAKSFIYRNDKGKFTDATAEVNSEISELGMITDALWTDFDNDGDLDLIIVGEWVNPTFFENNRGKLKNITAETGLGDQTGWWFSINEADIDNDGDLDYVFGNLGTNYKYQATPEFPFKVYSKDFDNNGQNDIVLGYYNNQELFPVRGRQCSSQQIPDIKKKYETYNEFATASLIDIYGDMGIDEALEYQVRNFSSSYIENKGKGKFSISALPRRAQIAPVNGSVIDDYNGDGNLDILIAGNLYVAEVETPRADGGVGLLLTGDGTGKFDEVQPSFSGFLANGDVKKVEKIRLVNGKRGVIIARNDDSLMLYVVN